MRYNYAALAIIGDVLDALATGFQFLASGAITPHLPPEGLSMARPKTPLISRQAAVASALDLIDQDGVEKFSLRKLGAKIGVHGMSLYHHFKDKDEILDEVVSLALGELRPTPPPSGDIIGWTLANAIRYRRALLKHQNVIPLMIKRLPRDRRSEMYRQEFAALESLGITRAHWLTILEHIEAFILGTVVFLGGEAEGPDESRPRSEKQAGRDTPDAEFEFVFRAFVAALYTAYAARDPAVPDPERTDR